MCSSMALYFHHMSTIEMNDIKSIAISKIISD